MLADTVIFRWGDGALAVTGWGVLFVFSAFMWARK